MDPTNFTTYEEKFYFYLKDRAGTFYTNLINTIFSADTDNFKLLQTIYPELCNIIHNYRNTPGYSKRFQDD